MAPGTEYLSFNSKVSPNNAAWQQPTPEELEDMKSKDPELRDTWAIWEQIMQTKDKSAGYSDATHKVATFGTVKTFWSYWNHLPQPSELLDGKKFVREQGDKKSVVDALMVFKEGIRPEWEDAINQQGGHFQIQLRPQLPGGVIDEYWNNIVLGIVGGTIEPAEMITGVRLVDKLNGGKPWIRIEVWFKEWTETEKIEQLERSLVKCMLTRLDGSLSEKGSFGKIDKKPHAADKGKK